MPKWVSKQAVLAIHEQLLAEHGGAPGLRDEGLLEAALASPMNHSAYKRADVLRLAAAYAYSLTRNHPFADGNKRVALTVAGVFLELNGFRLEATEQDAAQAIRALSSRDIGEIEFARWLRTCTLKLRAAPRPKPRTAKIVRRRGPKRR